MRKYTFFLLFSLILTLAACGTNERYQYVADAPHNVEMPITNNFSATIFPNDQLYITVSSSNPTSVKPFNEETYRKEASSDNIKGYTVSQSGDIIFPILGRLHVAGMSRSDLERDIAARLIEGNYVSDPVVSVNLLNFQVSVIGEVQIPSLIRAVGSRLTIFEALAQAGDITIDGLRTNVVIVRTTGKTDIVDTLDLTRKEILDSPYYYLQQNDILYVEPNAKKKKKAWRDEDWPSYINLATSGLRVAYLTVSRIARTTH